MEYIYSSSAPARPEWIDGKGKFPKFPVEWKVAAEQNNSLTYTYPLNMIRMGMNWQTKQPAQPFHKVGNKKWIKRLKVENEWPQ